MKKWKIIKITALCLLGVGGLFLLYFGLCHIIMGAQAPTLQGVNVDYNTHFMGLHIMGICFLVGFLLVLAVMLFIIFFKRKPKKPKNKKNHCSSNKQENEEIILLNDVQEGGQDLEKEL